MINSKNKGSAYERKIVKELKDITFLDIKTSRAESKSLDDNKVDIFGMPFFNIQTKFYKNYISLNKLNEVLNVMPKDDNINVIIHKANRQDELVIITKDDF